MPKSVWSKEKRPVTLIPSASAPIFAGTCSVRVLPCSVIATLSVMSPRLVLAPLTPMSANGTLCFQNFFQHVGAGSFDVDSLGWCRTGLGAQRRLVHLHACSATYRTARPSSGAT